MLQDRNVEKEIEDEEECKVVVKMSYKMYCSKKVY